MTTPCGTIGYAGLMSIYPANTEYRVRRVTGTSKKSPRRFWKRRGLRAGITIKERRELLAGLGDYLWRLAEVELVLSVAGEIADDKADEEEGEVFELEDKPEELEGGALGAGEGEGQNDEEEEKGGEKENCSRAHRDSLGWKRILVIIARDTCHGDTVTRSTQILVNLGSETPVIMLNCGSETPTI